MKARTRIEGLDFLRGFMIFLAMIQHFSHIIQDAGDFSPATALSPGVYWLNQIFTPWVSQIYLFLAAFNLASRKGRDFAGVLPAKLKTYGIFTLLFVLESFVANDSLDQALTFDPVLAWMLLLAITALIARLAGWRGVAAAFVLQLCAIAFLPLQAWGDHLQSGLRSLTSLPKLEYEARLHFFAGSCFLGFLGGWLWHHHRKGRRAQLWITLFAAGLAGEALWYASGGRFYTNLLDIFQTEHDLALRPKGLFSVWSCQIAAVSLVLWAQCLGRSIRFEPLNWIGRHSLLIYLFHKVFYTFVILRIRLHLAQLWGWRLSPSIPETVLSIAFTCGVVWILLRVRAFERLSGATQTRSA